MKKYWIKDLTEKQAIHAPTLEIAQRLCKKFHMLGLKWRDGDSYIEDVIWHNHKESTSYCPSNGLFGSTSWFEENNYEILNIDQILDFDDIIDIEESFEIDDVEDYKTRNGLDAKVYNVHNKGEFSVKGAIFIDGNWQTAYWNYRGKFHKRNETQYDIVDEFPKLKWHDFNHSKEGLINKSILIKGVRKNTKYLTIPSEIQEIPVKEIGEHSFKGKNLKEVEFPGSIERIGDHSFSENQLKEVKLPESVKYLGYNAFDEYVKITQGGRNIRFIDGIAVYIYNKIKLGEYTFYSGEYHSSFDSIGVSFVVEKDGLFSRGDTIKEAVGDIEYKLLKDSFDIKNLVKDIKEKQTLSLTEYRLLTNSDREACLEFLKKRKVKEHELNLSEALDLINSSCGKGIVKKYFHAYI